MAAVEDAGAQAGFVAADLSDPGRLAELAERSGTSRSSLLDLGPTADLGIDEFDALFAANVRAPYYLVAAFAPGMAARGHGSIINIGSMAGTIGMASGAAYGATKAALGALTRAWTAEYSRSGVRVNNVAAGPTYTRPEMHERSATTGQTTALRRAAQPEEIAELVAFLASPKASYITGATLAADGGRTAI